MTGARPRMNIPQLSDRHIEVVARYAIGQQQPAVAAAMGVSVNTVKTWTRELFERLGAVNNANAVHLAHEAGHLTPQLMTRIGASHGPVR